MADSRAVLRTGLIGGIVIGLAVAAQQITDSPDFQCLGFVIILTGLGVVGYLAARDMGDYQRMASMRSGAVGGLIAGLIASLAAVAVLIFLSISGVTMLRINEAIQQMPPELLKQYADMEISTTVLARTTEFIQILCCPAGLPIMGVLLGTLGGIFVSNVYRGQKPGESAEE